MHKAEVRVTGNDVIFGNMCGDDMPDAGLYEMRARVCSYPCNCGEITIAIHKRSEYRLSDPDDDEDDFLGGK